MTGHVTAHLTATVAATLLMAAALTTPAGAQPVCDPDKVVHDIPEGYKARGDRCEGFYGFESVGGDVLKIASFTRGKPSYSPGGGSLTLEWPGALTDAQIRIQAVSLRKLVHYQMDATPPPGATSFDWPTDVLAVHNLASDEVGVRAWVDGDQSCGGRGIVRHVPLVVRQGAAPPDASYSLVVLPGFDLSRFEVQLERLAEDRASAEPIGPRADIGRTSYAAKGAISMSPPVPPEGGTYRIRMMVRRSSDGRSFSDIFCFTNAAP